MSRPSVFSFFLSISSHISPSFSLNRDLHEGHGAAGPQSHRIRPPPHQILRKWIHPGQIRPNPTEPPVVRRLIEEYNSCPMLAKILQILSIEPPSLQEDFDEWLTKKLPQILQEAQVWSRPRKSKFKSSRRRGVWRFPPPVAALLVVVACSYQIQHGLSYRFSIASLCFMCICAEKMTTPPLFFASHTLSHTLPCAHNNHHRRSLADRRCAFWRKRRRRFLLAKKMEASSEALASNTVSADASTS